MALNPLLAPLEVGYQRIPGDHEKFLMGRAAGFSNGVNGKEEILKRLVDREDSTVVLKRYLLISVHEVFHMSRTIVVGCQG